MKCNRRNRIGTIESLESRLLFAAEYYVAPTGDDANPGTDPATPWRTIQHAFNSATAGSNVTVMAGRYNEKVKLNVSGNATDGFITYRASGKAIISGKGIEGPNIIHINNQSYVKIVGFDIRDNKGVSDGSGIRLTSGGEHIQLLGNKIHDILGDRAMGITVYGTDPARPLSNIVIDSNEIYRCQPSRSETLTLNGNVSNFVIASNYIHDVNSIGIDVIGGEGICPDPAVDYVRDGIIYANRVTRARSKRNTRDAAGIWVDGARNITIEKNTVWRNDVGIEVGALHTGAVTSNIILRNNVVRHNQRSGMVIGEIGDSAGIVQDVQVLQNTLYLNGQSKLSSGDLRLSYVHNTTLENNIVQARNRGVIVLAEGTAENTISNYNLFYSSSGSRSSKFVWGSQPIKGYTNFLNASGQDVNSIFANAKFKTLCPHLRSSSPAINAGNPAFQAFNNETDIVGDSRVIGGRIDIGADEVVI